MLQQRLPPLTDQVQQTAQHVPSLGAFPPVPLTGEHHQAAAGRQRLILLIRAEMEGAADDILEVHLSVFVHADAPSARIGPGAEMGMPHRQAHPREVERPRQHPGLLQTLVGPPHPNRSG